MVVCAARRRMSMCKAKVTPSRRMVPAVSKMHHFLRRSGNDLRFLATPLPSCKPSASATLNANLKYLRSRVPLLDHVHRPKKRPNLPQDNREAKRDAHLHQGIDLNAAHVVHRPLLLNGV